ncbi:uncharacterized protein LOC141524163 [Cotesia typhae]|uniref:uncharacterized protein LOC141524163 n=1 Tax=Cotesia typhae TaxID=2053667 RepID=UPI003D69B326
MNLKITNNDNDCKICRLSNKKVENILSISNHDNYSGLGLKFKQKLDIHGGVEIEENDGLLNKICVECVAKMIIDYGIWKQSRISLTLLQDFYSRIAEKISTVLLHNQTGDFLGIEITNRTKRLYDPESLPWLKESIALRISQLNKNYSEHGVCNKKVNNISESKAEGKQKSFNTTNLDTKKLITNEHLSETLNNSCTTKKQSFESVLNSDVCKEQEKLPKNSVEIIYVPINNGNENKDINIDNNSNQFIIIKATNKVITSLREYRIEEYINYIIENDHCYTSFARSEVKKSPKESQPIVLNDLDSRNMLEESIESINIHGKKCYVSW